MASVCLPGSKGATPMRPASAILSAASFALTATASATSIVVAFVL